MKKSYRTLEFSFIQDYIKNYCFSEMAKKRIDQIQPFQDMDDLKLYQDDISSAMKIIYAYGRIPLAPYEDIKEILQKVLIVALMAFAVAGWWFIRNAIIYDGDILGMKTQVECGDKYAIDKYKPSKRETPQKNNESVMDMLIKDDWIKTTLKSFVGIFGYQNIIMSSRIYQFYLILWGLGIIGCLINFKELFIYNKKEKNRYLLNYIFIPSIIIPIILRIYYSYTSEYQAQGRYIMGIIIPFTYFIVSGIKTILEKFIKSEKIRNIIIIVIMVIIILIAQRALFGYIIPTYK